MAKTLYTAQATTIGGRDGKTNTSDNALTLQLSRPGGDKPGTNPEQLFACGYSACFGSALAHLAQLEKVDAGEIKVQADVSLNQDDKGFFIGVVLNVSMAGVDRETAEKLVTKAHEEVCPYSKATRNNVDVQLKVNDEDIRAAA